MPDSQVYDQSQLDRAVEDERLRVKTLIAAWLAEMAMDQRSHAESMWISATRDLGGPILPGTLATFATERHRLMASAQAGLDRASLIETLAEQVRQREWVP
jgi:hypothetical protein